MGVKKYANKYTIVGVLLGVLVWPRVKGKINMPG
jgi:hypothetical protein